MLDMPTEYYTTYRSISSMGNTNFVSLYSHRMKNKDFICLSFDSQDHIHVHVQQFDK